MKKEDLKQRLKDAEEIFNEVFKHPIGDNATYLLADYVREGIIISKLLELLT